MAHTLLTENGRIPCVRVIDNRGKVTEYTVKTNPPTPAEIAKADKRRMDCVDCHNRPTQIYSPPDLPVYRAIAIKTIRFWQPSSGEGCADDLRFGDFTTAIHGTYLCLHLGQEPFSLDPRLYGRHEIIIPNGVNLHWENDLSLTRRCYRPHIVRGSKKTLYFVMRFRLRFAKVATSGTESKEKRGFAMSTETQTIETEEDVKWYRAAFCAAILALQSPSDADVLICHALGVAL